MSKIKLTLGTGGITKRRLEIQLQVLEANGTPHKPSLCVGTGKNFTAGSDMAMLRQTFIEASEIRQV